MTKKSKPKARTARPTQPAVEISVAASFDCDHLKKLDQLLVEIINGNSCERRGRPSEARAQRRVGRESGWPAHWRAMDETTPLAPIYDLLPPSPPRAKGERRKPPSLEQSCHEMQQQARTLKGPRRKKVLDMIETHYVTTHRWHYARYRLRLLIDRALALGKAANMKRLLWDLERMRSWVASDRHLDISDTPSSYRSVLEDLKQRRQELAVEMTAAFHGLGDAPSSIQGVVVNLKQRREELAVEMTPAFDGLSDSPPGHPATGVESICLDDQVQLVILQILCDSAVALTAVYLMRSLKLGELGSVDRGTISHHLERLKAFGLAERLGIRRGWVPTGRGREFILYRRRIDPPQTPH